MPQLVIKLPDSDIDVSEAENPIRFPNDTFGVVDCYLANKTINYLAKLTATFKTSTKKVVIKNRLPSLDFYCLCLPNFC